MCDFIRFLSVRRLSALAALALSGLVVGCTSTGDASGDARPAGHSVTLVSGCAVELDHAVYDPALPGYWVVGSEAMIQLSRLPEATDDGELVLMIRTKPDASLAAPSRLDSFRILTRTHRIVTKFDPSASTVAPVDVIAVTIKKEGTEAVLVMTDTAGRYLSFKQEGERVRVTFTPEGLRLIGSDAAISWKDSSRAVAPVGTPAETTEARRIL